MLKTLLMDLKSYAGKYSLNTKQEIRNMKQKRHATFRKQKVNDKLNCINNNRNMNGQSNQEAETVKM